MEQLRQNPTDELYLSWHLAISEMTLEWPVHDIQYVEKAVFMLDGGAVNFPAVYWYLHHLPDDQILELSEKWLGGESVATETQKNELRKAFGHAIMWFDQGNARAMFEELRDEKQRRIFLEGVDRVGKDAGAGWWMRWRHDTGIREM